MATKKKAPAKKAAKKAAPTVGYNTIAAVEGSVGAPPLAKVLKATTGKDVRSVVLRVDADFADKVRSIAVREKRTVTSVTRTLLEQMK